MILAVLTVLIAVLLPIYVYRLLFPSYKQTISPRNKYVLLTGAAGGIGKETGHQLLRMGAKVIACDINEEALNSAYEEFLKQQPPRVHVFKMDVTNQDDINRVAESVKKLLESSEEKRLFGLVNNAGIGLHSKVAGVVEKGEAEWTKLFNINTFSVFRMVNAFYPLMTQNPKFTKKSDAGCIVNISSFSGKVAVPGWSWYCATKFAVLGYTETLRREMNFIVGTHHYVRVTTILPGLTYTPILSTVGPQEDSIFLEVGKRLQYALKNAPTMQNTDKVAQSIIMCLLSENNPAQHLSESKWLYRFIWLGSMYLPYTWQDKILEYVIYLKAVHIDW